MFSCDDDNYDEYIKERNANITTTLQYIRLNASLHVYDFAEYRGGDFEKSDVCKSLLKRKAMYVNRLKTETDWKLRFEIERGIRQIEQFILFAVDGSVIKDGQMPVFSAFAGGDTYEEFYLLDKNLRYITSLGLYIY